MTSGYYDITNKTLGRGHYGVVKLARHCLTGEPVAIKIIEKVRLNNDSLNQLGTEIRILFRLSEYEHPNILKIYQTIDREDKLYLVTEYCGPHACDLHDYLLRKQRREGLAEKEAQMFFIQICSAISYCHSMNIVHRDLKPENILVTDYKHMNINPSMDKSSVQDFQYPLLKLIDFGFANQLCPDEKMRTSCGTLAYSAPELLLGEPYDGTKVDVWGLGLMLYILLYGGNPFMQINDNETLTKILDCSFAIPTREDVDNSANELLRSLIERNPDKRLPIDAILRHKWFSTIPKPYELAQNHKKNLEQSRRNSMSPPLYRPTSPDVGGSMFLSEEERKLHELVLREIIRLTKPIESKSSVEVALKNARFSHRSFNQNSIQPSQCSKRKVPSSLLVTLSQSKGVEAPTLGDGIPVKQNKILNNDDYIYASYQLIRDRLIRLKQGSVNSRSNDEKPVSSSSGQAPIPEEGDMLNGTEMSECVLTSNLSAKENGRKQQRKLLQPQHRMKDKFTSFFRAGSTSASSSSGGELSTVALASKTDDIQHEAFNDHNNESSNSPASSRYFGSKADSLKNSMAYALPLARKCSLVSEESGCSNDLSDNQ